MKCSTLFEVGRADGPTKPGTTARVKSLIFGRRLAVGRLVQPGMAPVVDGAGIVAAHTDGRPDDHYGGVAIRLWPSRSSRRILAGELARLAGRIDTWTAVAVGWHGRPPWTPPRHAAGGGIPSRWRKSGRLPWDDPEADIVSDFRRHLDRNTLAAPVRPGVGETVLIDDHGPIDGLYRILDRSDRTDSSTVTLERVL